MKIQNRRTRNRKTRNRRTRNRKTRNRRTRNRRVKMKGGWGFFNGFNGWVTPKPSSTPVTGPPPVTPSPVTSRFTRLINYFKNPFNQPPPDENKKKDVDDIWEEDDWVGIKKIVGGTRKKKKI